MATVQTAKKMMLGREIEHMLSEAGKTPSELAAILSTSRSRVQQILDGKASLSIGDLERLANQLGFTDPGYHETLFELRKDSHKRGYWNTGYRRAYSEELRVRVDIESHADRIREWEVEIPPGLTQPPRFVRALYAGVPESSGLTLEDRIEARTARQAIFDKPNPPVAHFVMSESCLRRVWRDEETKIDLLKHMIALSQRENIFMQVLPFDQPVGRRVAIGNRFTLLRLPTAGVAGPLELAYTEGPEEFRYLDDKKALDAYDSAWTRLTSAALGFEETRRFLRAMIAESGETSH
ncbi:helix-turn-helix domain-containing protein [Amycolatopsis roodepoortensis]|uniref:Transcriptional regulator with XRE-family HTH domain n=1 Tax=Amycolatopsis roodepoortensis TaxID=700274 RepID=A0ABR9LKE7_9PSEU|nr:helix-turn-helix transcriptional regulator [Amycolatopsis roodepoortensis]MBE1580556.1 transcriptional regulator with XRE-family HTH domain [Amycolatopsis roodepoortensis]